jgi:hypothetical protein
MSEGTKKTEAKIEEISVKTGAVTKLALQILKIFGIKLKKGPEVPKFE